jgi:CBS domain-containing protein
MSPRAACRLETLGFTEVYDYVAGKADWLAAGLATEGANGWMARVGSALDPDVMTCGLEDPVSDVARRLRATAAEIAIVVGSGRVVVGRLRLGRFSEGSHDAAAAVMEEGPTTVRASEPLEGILARMQTRNVQQVIVTTPEGELLGIVSAPARGAVSSP